MLLRERIPLWCILFNNSFTYLTCILSKFIRLSSLRHWKHFQFVLLYSIFTLFFCSYSVWSNYSFKQPLVVSLIFLAIGNLFYALALQCNSPYFIFIGRLFTGTYVTDIISKSSIENSSTTTLINIINNVCNVHTCEQSSNKYKIRRITLQSQGVKKISNS